MGEKDDIAASTGASRRTIVKGAVWTFVGAGLVTILFILPAEYGVDPTGLGERIGLTRLAGVSVPDRKRAPRIVRGTFPGIPAGDDFDYFDPEVLGAPYTGTHSSTVRTDTFEIELDVYEQVEYKAVMNQGDALVFSWRLVEGTTVYSDFHADPAGNPAYPDRYWIRYAESEEASGSGSVVAPFDGNHGWYWLNIEEEPIRIELKVHGFYENLTEIMRSFQ